MGFAILVHGFADGFASGLSSGFASNCVGHFTERLVLLLSSTSHSLGLDSKSTALLLLYRTTQAEW